MFFLFFSRGKKNQPQPLAVLPPEEPSTSIQIDRTESDDEEMGFFSEDVSALLLLMESLE